MNATTDALQSSCPGKGAPRLREISLRDHGQISALESKYGLLSKSYDEWSHLWLGNPLYRKLQGAWSMGWVLEDEQHQIVSSIGNIPLAFDFEGKPILAASGCDWVAEPQYRSFSLELLERVVNQHQVELYINNTVSRESVGPVTVLNCARVPVGIWDKSAFWITDYREFSQSYLQLKRYPLTNLLSYPLSAVVFLKDLFSNKGLRDGDVEVQACSHFDERFDDFWEQLRCNRPHVLLAVRTREMLEWHYKHVLLDGRLWILTIVDGTRLAAYATFERKDKPQIGLKRMSLVDFQSLDGNTALLLPLLSWAAKKCGEEGIHVLESVGRWLGKGELLEKITPYRRKAGAWCYFYRANDPKLAERLREPHAWDPSLFDGDASLSANRATPSASPLARRRYSPASQAQVSASDEQQAMRPS